MAFFSSVPGVLFFYSAVPVAIVLAGLCGWYGVPPESMWLVTAFFALTGAGFVVAILLDLALGRIGMLCVAVMAALATAVTAEMAPFMTVAGNVAALGLMLLMLLRKSPEPRRFQKLLMIVPACTVLIGLSATLFEVALAFSYTGLLLMVQFFTAFSLYRTGKGRTGRKA